MHIGSQITELAPYAEAYRLMAELVALLRGDGHDIRHLDLGGGLGVPYRGRDEIPPASARLCRAGRGASWAGSVAGSSPSPAA